MLYLRCFDMSFGPGNSMAHVYYSNLETSTMMVIRFIPITDSCVLGPHLCDTLLLLILWVQMGYFCKYQYPYLAGATS